MAMDQLKALGIAIAGLAISLVVTFLVIGNANTQLGTITGTNLTIDPTICDNYISCNATNTMTGAVATIPGWVPLIVIVVIGAAILGLIRMFRQ